MTALAEKLKDAGADTVGARFTAACVDALRKNPNIDHAWHTVGREFGHQFLRDMQADMKGGHIIHQAAPKFRSEYGGPASRMAVPVVRDVVKESQPYQPRVLPPERIERRKVLQEVVRSKFKNSAGVSWSDVGWHELVSLSRDGNEAGALLKAGPAHVPNDGRTVGQVLGVTKVDEIIQKARGE